MKASKFLFGIFILVVYLYLLAPVIVVIFTSFNCVFRVIPAGNSGRSRPPIPIDSVHPFRGKPST
ncbi:hypothetical protein D1AOALGA4SA_7794, partial [Olavius algarvensis Delta 1 endosymbiont]